MNTEAQVDLIRQIVNPDPSNAPKLLRDLGLAEPPSTEQVHREIEEKLLLPKPSLPKHWLPHYQVNWEPKLELTSLLSLEPSPPPTTLELVRSGLDGRITGFVERPTRPTPSGLTSTSLDRAPGSRKDFVRGKSGNMPFWPGGLEGIPSDVTVGLDDTPHQGLKTVPPGFSRGLQSRGEETDETDLLVFDSISAKEHRDQKQSEIRVEHDEETNEPIKDKAEIDELLPMTRSHLKPIKSTTIKTRRQRAQKKDWAHVVDVNEPLKNFHKLVPEMARKYPFELDTFQKQAVYHLEKDESVFVAAHTSAGKTVVAEYAIALAERHMTRTIYTSPIKALSNQKYRDFKQTFSSSSVGILTGDVQINPEASCLVMTTEILRSMLYKGADLIRDVEFVIFDEVHYVNDAERGVVWEEVIIMLPEHVNIILLSATVPNAKEFADWVGRTKKKDIYVISTPKRPVPLEHYLYVGKDKYKIVSADRNFISDGYKDAGEALKRKQDKEREAAGLPPIHRVGARGASAAQKNNQRGGAAQSRGGRVTPSARGSSMASRTMHTTLDKNIYVHLLGHLKKNGLLPTVVFTFSKKRCEENASTLTNADLCTSVEKSEVHVTIEKALSRLKDSDKKLPQLARMRDLLSRGIGVHHGGLLPLVKELVEILFARGLVKILFATETFAMGVNMPAKCVVFSSIRKHDGRSFRDILPGEYTQMAGRAGRRGLDTTGTVVIVASSSLPEQATLHKMILGEPGKLSSQFRLTYSMILNLLRVEALKVEEMIKRSFSENSSQRLLPENQRKVQENQRLLESIQKLSCEICLQDMEAFYDDSFEVVELNRKLLDMTVTHFQGSKTLSVGRVVVLKDGHFKTGNIGVLLKQAPSPITETGKIESTKAYFVLALVHPGTKTSNYDVDLQEIPPLWPPAAHDLYTDGAVYELKAVPVTSICLVTNRTIKIDVGLILTRRAAKVNEDIALLLQELLREWRSQQKIPEIDWNRVRAMDFQETLQARNALAERLRARACLHCPNFTKHYAIIHGEKVLRAKIAELKILISDQNLELIPDYEQRIEVLKALKFIDDNSTVLLKGRVACEINSVNELVLTELILENALAKYTAEETVALLSCFVFQEKTDEEPVIPLKLEEGRDTIITINDRIERIQDAHKVAGEEHRSSVNPGLIEVVYEWANGMPFKEITGLTDVPEGTIVRVITRLDETCREVRDAARVIGDAELFRKMEECQVKIKRDSE
ncbi:hypothetical protein AX15_004008 [Amanita polypyramis BW_CC]|nr:hypothetical protein AX15_004008 [Amanita polypyramis BW_CC]